MPTRQGVICIEGPWTGDLRQQDSVRLLMEFFARSNGYQLIHRQVSTVAELRKVVRTIRAQRYQSFKLLYLACHGVPGAVKLGSRKVPLRELALMLGSSWKGSHVVLGCCSALKSARVRDNFLTATRIKSLVGYSKDPDWIEGSALDLMVMECLMWPWQPKRLRKWLGEKCGGLVEEYGLEICYRPNYP